MLQHLTRQRFKLVRSHSDLLAWTLAPPSRATYSPTFPQLFDLLLVLSPPSNPLVTSFYTVHEFFTSLLFYSISCPPLEVSMFVIIFSISTFWLSVALAEYDVARNVCMHINPWCNEIYCLINKCRVTCFVQWIESQLWNIHILLDSGFDIWTQRFSSETGLITPFNSKSKSNYLIETWMSLSIG